MTPEALAAAKDAIIKVGEGRGFLVEDRRGRFVITAAHCLPHLPPAHLLSYPHERFYANLLGQLDVNPTVGCQCLFVNPIADLAVLCEPDSQELCDEYDAYEELTDGRPALPLGTVTAPRSGWLLTKAGDWARCTVKLSQPGWNGCLKIADVSDDAVAFGTSGSPILTDDGLVIGLISCGNEPNPVLSNALPAGLLAHLLRGNDERKNATGDSD